MAYIAEMRKKENTTELFDDAASAAYVDVIIPLALPKTFTWSVPSKLLPEIVRGGRVEVGLGKNKKYAGIVKCLHDRKPSAFEPKLILNILDAEPVIFPEQLSLWEWLADYYMCSEGEVMQAALPSHFKLSSETVLVFNEEIGNDFTQLDEEEYLVAEALQMKTELRLTEVQQVLDTSHVYPVIKRLIDKSVCFVLEELKDTYKEKTETYIQLNPVYKEEEMLAPLLNDWGARAPKQLELLLSYLHLSRAEGEVKQADLLKKSGANPAQLKGLIDKNILWPEKRAVDRIRLLPKAITIDFELSEAQENALQKIQTVFAANKVCLLHGVTSSGKTQVYIKLMEEALNQGKQVLYMLPEIALTAQIIRRLQKHFGGYITVYHSKFNHNERVEIWNKIKSGEAKIILGARSSLFLPYKELGLVICDEEHDPSYKQQDPAPRYHARDAAIYLASLFKPAGGGGSANVLLGSATPSLESYYNAHTEKYGLVEMKERYGAIAMPRIEIVDTKKIQTPDKSRVIISPELHDAIEGCVAQDKQAILFQNRRGYSPYQVCQTCGWVPHCKNCDVSLTYHKITNKLQCHYCGTVYSVVHTCEACGNHKFAQQNFGTERIEEELQAQFPSVKVSRMDIDSVKGKTAHDTLIRQFEEKKVDILVGTQMVVKGLDFEHVDLVGILDGDAILSFTDFRVNERAFQLMEQVSGRAGRKGKQGTVLIQVRNINHPVLQWVQQHDYPRFFQEEINNRKRFSYPPFTRLILVTFRHKEAEVVADASVAFAEKIKQRFGRYMVGPAQPVVNRVRNQYLMELLFKLPKDAVLINSCKQSILEHIALLHQDKRFRSVQVVPDVDVIK